MILQSEVISKPASTSGEGHSSYYPGTSSSPNATSPLKRPVEFVGITTFGSPVVAFSSGGSAMVSFAGIVVVSLAGSVVFSDPLAPVSVALVSSPGVVGSAMIVLLFAAVAFAGGASMYMILLFASFLAMRTAMRIMAISRRPMTTRPR